MCMGGGGASSGPTYVPPPPAAPAAPIAADATTAAAGVDARLRGMAQGGYSSTLLTGPAGLAAPATLQGKTLLGGGQ